DARPFAEPHEVDVDREVAHRIELEVARDHAMLRAIQFEFVDAGEKSARVNLLPQVGVIEGNVERRLAVAINDARHAAFATHSPSGPLTGPRARRRLDLFDGRHIQSSGSVATQTAADAAVPPGRPPGVHQAGFARLIAAQTGENKKAEMSLRL